MLLILYTALLLWQIVWLTAAVRRRGGWERLLALDVCCTLLAVGLMRYYNSLPGYGMMPGLAYFEEVFYSLGAAVVFAVLSLVGLLGLLFHRKK